MSWTDEEIDKLFQDKANDLSFEFKPEYWQEFNEALSNPDLGAMAGEFDEVDQLYQLSANELTFQYKDAYWQEVQGMLPRKRRPDFLWFGTAGVFLTALTLGSVLQMNRAVSVPVVAENQVAEEVLAPQSNESTVPVNEPSYTTIGTQNSPNADDYPVNGATVIAPINRNEEGDQVVAELNTPLRPAETVVKPENNFAASVTDPSNAGLRIPVEPESEPVAIVPANSEENPIDGRENLPNNTSENTDKLDVDTNPATNTIEAVNSLPTVALNTNQETPALADFQGNVGIQELRLPVRSTFYVEVNGGLSQSLITPSESISYSTGFGIGAQFQKGRFSFTTGLNAIWNFHDDIVLNRESKVYGFGSEVYRYTLKYDHIYSLEAVLNAGYRFGRHQITAGVRPSFAFGSKVGVTLLEEEVETERQISYGHMEGLKRFGLKPMIGYAVDLPANFTIGVNLGFQTMKSVDEQFINGKNNFLPIDGQLYLRKGINFRRAPKVMSR